jgi:hypothetical protein
MSLIDDLVSIESRRGTYPGPQCTVAKIMGQISEDDRAQLCRVLDNPDVPGSVIAGALTRNGYPVADKTVLRHRKRGTSSGCHCPKEDA